MKCVKIHGDGNQTIQTDMENNMKKLLNWLKQWPAIMTLFMLVMTVTIFFVEPKAGIVMSGFTMGYIVILMLMYFHNKTLVISNPKGIAEQYGFLQNTLLKEIAFPVVCN